MALVVQGLSDEALLAELQRRGLASYSLSPDCSQGSRAFSPPERLRRSLSPCSSLGEERCLLEPGPGEGGPLAPMLVNRRRPQVFRLLEIGGVRGRLEQRWKRLQPGDTEGSHSVARLRRQGKTIHVCGLDGAERFQIKSSSWNPIHLCFTIWRVGEEKKGPLFTLRRDCMGLGPLKEQWRLFRGSEREDELYFLTNSSAFGWDYGFYRSRQDYDVKLKARAQLEQLPGTGLHCQETGVWVPAEFCLSLGPGEDAGLLLAMATVLDSVHGRSQPCSSVL